MMACLAKQRKVPAILEVSAGTVPTDPGERKRKRKENENKKIKKLKHTPQGIPQSGTIFFLYLHDLTKSPRRSVRKIVFSKLCSAEHMKRHKLC
jgi:hypothetical protein